MRKIKSILALMLVCLLTVGLCACGGGQTAEEQLSTQATMDQKGFTYTDTTQSEYTTFKNNAGTITAENINKGNHISSVMVSKYGEMSMNVYVTYTDGKITGLLNKTSMKYIIGETTKEFTFTSFLKDNKMYISYTYAGKEYNKYAELTDAQITELDYSPLEATDIEDMFEEFEGYFEQLDSKIKLQKATKGTETRFLISGDATMNLGTANTKTDYSVCIGINNKELSGTDIRIKTINVDTQKVLSESINAIVPFTAKIAYPSTKGFEKADYTTLQNGLNDIISSITGE